MNKESVVITFKIDNKYLDMLEAIAYLNTSSLSEEFCKAIENYVESELKKELRDEIGAFLDEHKSKQDAMCYVLGVHPAAPGVYPARHPKDSNPQN